MYNKNGRLFIQAYNNQLAWHRRFVPAKRFLFPVPWGNGKDPAGCRHLEMLLEYRLRVRRRNRWWRRQVPDSWHCRYSWHFPRCLLFGQQSAGADRHSRYPHQHLSGQDSHTERFHHWHPDGCRKGRQIHQILPHVWLPDSGFGWSYRWKHVSENYFQGSCSTRDDMNSASFFNIYT